MNLFRDIDFRKLRQPFLKEPITQVRLFELEVRRDIENFQNIAPTAEALFNEIFPYFQNNIDDFLEQAVRPLLGRLSEKGSEQIQIPLRRRDYQWQRTEWPVIRILTWCRNKLEHFYMYESNAFIIRKERAGIREKRISDYSESLSMEDIFKCISAEVINWEEIASVSEGINSEQLKLLALRNCYFTVTKMWADYFSLRREKLNPLQRTILKIQQTIFQLNNEQSGKELNRISYIRSVFAHSDSCELFEASPQFDTEQNYQSLLVLHNCIRERFVKEGIRIASEEIREETLDQLFQQFSTMLSGLENMPVTGEQKKILNKALTETMNKIMRLQKKMRRSSRRPPPGQRRRSKRAKKLERKTEQVMKRT